MNPTHCVMCKKKVIFGTHYYPHRYVCSECFNQLIALFDKNLINIIEEELSLRNTIINVLQKTGPRHTVFSIMMRQPFRGEYVTNETVKHYVSKQIRGEKKYREEIFTITSTSERTKFSVCHMHIEPIDVGIQGDPDPFCWEELCFRLIYLLIFNLTAPFLLGFVFPEVHLGFRIIGSILLSVVVFTLTSFNIQDTGIRKWQKRYRQMRTKAIKKARDEWLR